MTTRTHSVLVLGGAAPATTPVSSSDPMDDGQQVTSLLPSPAQSCSSSSPPLPPPAKSRRLSPDAAPWGLQQHERASAAGSCLSSPCRSCSSLCQSSQSSSSFPLPVELWEAVLGYLDLAAPDTLPLLSLLHLMDIGACARLRTIDLSKRSFRGSSSGGRRMASASSSVGASLAAAAAGGAARASKPGLSGGLQQQQGGGSSGGAVAVRLLMSRLTARACPDLETVRRTTTSGPAAAAAAQTHIARQASRQALNQSINHSAADVCAWGVVVSSPLS